VDEQIFSALVGFIGAIVGGVLAGGAVIWQTRRMLNAQNVQREADQEREGQSIAMALLWEIDDFYKLCIRNVSRALKTAEPAELGFYVKPDSLRSFTVFEATAGKIGLFEPALVQGIVSFYGQAKAYRETLNDYRNAMEQIQAGNRHEYHGKAVTLLAQIKGSAASFVPFTRTVCEALATRAGANYSFEQP